MSGAVEGGVFGCYMLGMHAWYLAGGARKVLQCMGPSDPQVVQPVVSLVQVSLGQVNS